MLLRYLNKIRFTSSTVEEVKINIILSTHVKLMKDILFSMLLFKTPQ